MQILSIIKTTDAKIHYEVNRSFCYETMLLDNVTSRRHLIINYRFQL